jgi:hypothetical protein
MQLVAAILSAETMRCLGRYAGMKSEAVSILRPRRRTPLLRDVLVTSAPDRCRPCILTQTVILPADRRSTLELTVGDDPCDGWDLGVRADGMLLLGATVGPDTTMAGWTQISIDLSPCAGQSVTLGLPNEPPGWHSESACWSKIALQAD